jgi:hypothetical protein
MFVLVFFSFVYDPPDPDLSHLLHSFSQSDQRRIIRQHAQEVPLESITFENFTSLLSSLFGVISLINYHSIKN